MILLFAPRLTIGQATSAKTSDYPLSTLSVWDDGLCEMSYYRATDRIYGLRRNYTRVHLLNRQWMDRKTGVKSERQAENAQAVFKFNITEELPTENYNYRYQTTMFLNRPDLSPFKMIVSSQEWCGASYKHLRWTPAGLAVQSFSYQPNEGDHAWRVSAESMPYEALPLIARDMVSRRTQRSFKVLAPMRSTHEVEPVVKDAKWQIDQPASISTPMGTVTVRRITLKWAGPETFFDVEVAAPYRLLRYRMGNLTGELVHVEHRAYWDRNWKSSFYPTGQAP